MNSFNTMKKMHNKIKGPPKWSTFGTGGINGNNVKAFAFDSFGNLYVGGDISGYRNDPSSTYTSSVGIVKWDGANWSNLGGTGVGLFTGSSSKSGYGTGTVNAIVCDSSDNLYIGGEFAQYGSSRSIITPAKNIIKYNILTQSWSQIGPGNGGGVDNVVNALALDSLENLYVGGAFTGYYNSAGTVVSARRIAKWDNSQWSTVGAGSGGGGVSTASGSVETLSFVSTIVYRSGIIYIGGNFKYVFNSTTTDTVTCIAKWDGTTLSKIDSTSSGLSSTSPCAVYTIAFDSTGTLYAGGLFSYIANSSIGSSGTSIYNIAKWNNGWGGINGSSGIYYACYSIVIDNLDNIYFGGSFSLNGQAATVMGVSGSNYNGIVKLSKTSWSAVGNGIGGGVDVSSNNTYPVYVLALYNNKLHVGGNFNGFYDTKGTSTLTPANNIAMYS